METILNSPSNSTDVSGLRLPFTLNGVFSFPQRPPLIRIEYPQTYISMESLWNYLNDSETIV